MNYYKKISDALDKIVEQIPYSNKNEYMPKLVYVIDEFCDACLDYLNYYDKLEEPQMKELEFRIKVTDLCIKNKQDVLEVMGFINILNKEP